MVPNNAQFDDRIRNLLALAEDNSTESRTLLFSHICDLFLQERPMETDNQKRMLIEIINELISDVVVTIRVELRNILLNMDHPPSELIKLISEDDVEVSGQLLEDAFIDEEQLLYLIKYASDEHRIHIGRRFGLSPLLRRELDNARREAEASAKIAKLALQAENKKISLQELEEAEQNSSELTEDTTASILETLRAKKNHPKSDLSIVPQIKELEVSNIELTKETISLTAKIGLSDQKQQSNHDKIAEEFSNATDEDILVAEEDSFEYVKEAVSQLIDQEEKISFNSNVTSVTDELFWEIDRYGNIIYLSDNSEALFLLPPDKMTGEDFLCLWHRDHGGEKEQNDIIALFEKRLPFREEPFLINVSPNVIHRYLLSAIATFDTDTGRFTGFRGSAHINNDQFNLNEFTVDIKTNNTSALKLDVEKSEIQDTPTTEFSAYIPLSDTKNSKEENSPSKDSITQKANHTDEVASELLHNLSHEFRTPLNAIIGFSQMIDSEMWGPVSDQYKNNSKNIINAANHLKDTVNNILDSAKIEAGLFQPSPEQFSLKSVIQDAMHAVSPILESRELNVTGIDDNIDVILYNDKHCIILCLIKMITYATRKADIGDNLHLSVLVSSNAEVRIEMPLINQVLKESDSHKLFQKINNFSKNDTRTRDKKAEFETKIASGYGLSVAQELANLIGGKIKTLSKNGNITHIALTISTFPV